MTGGGRRRPGRPALGPWWRPRDATARQRAALLALALGLVLMHHLVGAHQHSSGEHTAGIAGIAALGSTATSPDHGPSPAPFVGGHGYGHHVGAPDPVDPAVEHPGGVERALAAAPAAPGPGALLHQHPDGHDALTVLAHLCLAVLASAVALGVLLLVALRGRTAAEGGVARCALPSGLIERPPPLPLRLAQLQVLRL